MSDYGLIIKNTSGGIQIDSKYANFSLWDYGTDECTFDYEAGEFEGGGGSGWNTMNFTQTQKPVLCAIRPIDDYMVEAVNAIQPYSGGSPSGWFNAIGTRIGQYLPDFGWGDEYSFDVDWMVFTNDNSTLPDGDYGLVIRNSDDEVCFSSEERYLKILGVNVITDTWESQSDVHSKYVDVTVNDVDNNYFILTPKNFADSNGTSYTMGMMRLSATSIRIMCFISSYYGSGVLTGHSENIDSPMTLLEVNI